MVNAVSMDNVEHAYAVQQLRKSGKIAKIVSSALSLIEINLLRLTCAVASLSSGNVHRNGGFRHSNYTCKNV